MTFLTQMSNTSLNYALLRLVVLIGELDGDSDGVQEPRPLFLPPPVEGVLSPSSYTVQ